MPYTNIQFIGLSIYTGEIKKVIDVGILPAVTGKRLYHGVADDIADIAGRVQYLKEAIEFAHADTRTVQNADTLKVFVIPEFFFRGQNGAYPMSLLSGDVTLSGTDKWKVWASSISDRWKNNPVDALLRDDCVRRLTSASSSSLIGQLTDIVKDPQYSDWLFVFGSALFFSARADGNPDLTEFMKDGAPTVESLNKLNEALRPKIEVYNISIVMKGGFNSDKTNVQEQNTWTTIKEYKSSSDFLQEPTLGLSRAEVGYLEKHLVAATPPATELTAPRRYEDEFNDIHYRGGCISTIGDITVAVEICLDHSKGRLKKVPATLNTEYKPQSQIIPSAGMSIVPNNIATVDGGLIFNVDGYNNGTIAAEATARGHHMELAQLQASANGKYARLTGGAPADILQTDLNLIDPVAPGPVFAPTINPNAYFATASSESSSDGPSAVPATAINSGPLKTSISFYLLIFFC